MEKSREIFLEVMMNQTPWSSARHSNSYHHFFEGYTEKKVQIIRGNKTKEKLIRVYTSDYYALDVSNRNRVLLKLLCVALYLLSVACLVFLYQTDPAFNYAVYTGVTEFLTIILMVLLLVAVVNFLTTKKLMTIGEYKSSFQNLRRFSFLAAAAYGLDLIAIVLFFILHPSEFLSTALSGPAFFLVGGFSIFGIYLIVKKVPCRTVENPNTLENGSQIM